MDSHPHSPYRPTTALALGLVASIALFVVMSIVVMWSTSQELELLGLAYQGSVIYDDWIYANDRRQAIVSGFALLSFAVTAGLYLRWVFVTTNNARAFVDDFPANPVLSTAWYAIPGAHAWLPFRYLKAAYRASEPGEASRWQNRPVPRFLSLWWTLWLLFQFSILVSMGTDFFGAQLEYLVVGASAATIGSAIAVPLGVATALTVWRLSALQSRRAAGMAAARFAPVSGPWPGGVAQRV